MSLRLPLPVLVVATGWLLFLGYIGFRKVTCTLLIHFIRKGETEAVRKLVRLGFTPNEHDFLPVDFAANCGNEEILCMLLDPVRPDFHLQVLVAMEEVRRSQNTTLQRVVQQILTENSDAQEPSEQDRINTLLVVAALAGDVGQVRSLKQGLKADLSFGNNQALILAALNGHIDVVRQLLRYRQVDPSARENFALILASENGHVEVVLELLQDRRVDPGARQSKALVAACALGHVEVVKVLLACQGVDPCTKNNRPLRLAMKHRHYNVVEVLKRNPQVRARQITRPLATASSHEN